MRRMSFKRHGFMSKKYLKILKIKIIKNMEDLLKAAILLNAAQANINSFLKFKENCDDEFYDFKDFFNINQRDIWWEIGLGEGVQNRLGALLNEDNNWAERELERARNFGAEFINYYDSRYPARLKDIKNAPIGLYVKGNYDLAGFTILSTAVVGTRRCSHYGRKTAEKLGRALARVGFAVISGGARGIDGAGHEGCLAENGNTVAVLGTGIDIVYPSEHKNLFEKISRHGALITEYPVGAKGDPWHFPARNRIIMGIAGRTVIVESPEGGGAIGTAKLALEAGREIWCVPGRISDDVCLGTNRLLRDGAHVLTEISEFIQIISSRQNQLFFDLDFNLNNNYLVSSPPSNLSKNEKDVLAIIEKQENMTFDEILIKSGLNFAELQICLMMLQNEHLITQNMAGRYCSLT